jgi:hypothetical protein
MQKLKAKFCRSWRLRLLEKISNLRIFNAAEYSDSSRLHQFVLETTQGYDGHG